MGRRKSAKVRGEKGGHRKQERKTEEFRRTERLRESGLGQLLQCCCQLSWGFECPMSRLPPVLQQYMVGDSLA